MQETIFGNGGAPVTTKFSNKLPAIWSEICDASKGDIILIMAGEKEKTRKSLSNLRLHVAEKLKLHQFCLESELVQKQFYMCFVGNDFIYPPRP